MKRCTGVFVSIPSGQLWCAAMWMSIIFAAISFSGLVFMVGFLWALRRENQRSICSGIVASRPKVNDEEFGESWRRAYPQKCKDGDYYVELLENEIHAKKSSGLIRLAIRPSARDDGWRPESPRRIGIPQKHRFFH